MSAKPPSESEPGSLATTADQTADRRFRLLSFNIQVGMRTEHYGHYLTRAWRHALPGLDMHPTLDRMADLMRDYDFVAVQEGDAGSLRTRFVNQIEYLAERAGFAHHGFTVTRDLRPVAQHCLGFLSRHPPTRVTEHRLPGRVRGRRALHVEMGEELDALHIFIAHLSLGIRDQQHQLDFISRQVSAQAPSVLIGDLNCEPAQLRAHGFLRDCGLDLHAATPATYPSWRPARRLDHVLYSSHIELHELVALPQAISDHLPLSAQISVRPRR